MHKQALILWLVAGSLLLNACATPSNVTAKAARKLLGQPVFRSAHTGISIFDASGNKTLYGHQPEHYFLPASNTKIFTLYAGLKYLGDSLEGIRFSQTQDTLYLFPTGDPTLLHPGFKKQPVIEALQKSTLPMVMSDHAWQDEALGPGWAWEDYNEPFMAERSILPVYGNMIRWIQVSQKNTQAELEDSMQTFVFSEPEVNWKLRFEEDPANKTFMVKRKREENVFVVRQGNEDHRELPVPFITNGLASAVELLKDTTGREVLVEKKPGTAATGIIYSQPADSVYMPMMHNSDNFFAEQVLLMASYKKLGVMNSRAFIENLLATDLKGVPQKPHWVDGSGLSRYNLFTPADFVWMLDKMRKETGMEKMKTLLPGSGQGTLRGYYMQDSGFIFAKTGTLQGQVALSGYLITPRNKLLVFSVLVNNFQGSATDVRRSVENFLHDVRRKN
jgi:D-alanyl-D-alanine carboxypeptidase/D-alanyl-D-alanine-endopeptidase (penicillin-binding protein 4)